MENGKKFANSVEELLLNVNVIEKSSETLYITGDRQIWKCKPYIVAGKEKDEWGEEVIKKEFVAPIAIFVAKEIKSIDQIPEHELLQTAKEAIQSVSKQDASIYVYELNFEVYKGDFEELLGEAVAHLIQVDGSTPRLPEKQQWAIAFEWKKRISVKYPVFANLITLWRGKKFVHVTINLPLVSKELRELFNRALSQTSQPDNDLLSEIKKKEEEIRQKEEELRKLKEELEELKRRLSETSLKEKIDELKAKLV